MIISANLTSVIYKKRIKKNFKNIVHIQIESNLNILKRRDKKLIYIKKVNVVGKDIKIHKTSNSYDFLIFNNTTKKKFLTQGDIILKKIKLKCIKFISRLFEVLNTYQKLQIIIFGGLF